MIRSRFLTRVGAAFGGLSSSFVSSLLSEEWFSSSSIVSGVPASATAPFPRSYIERTNERKRGRDRQERGGGRKKKQR